MTLFFIGLLAYGIGAVAAIASQRRYSLSACFGSGGAIVGGTCLTVPSIAVLGGSPPQASQAAWAVPFGSLSFQLDPLAAAVLVPIAIIGTLGAIYGTGYLRAEGARRPAGSIFAAYNLLLAFMAVVVTASNLILFLVAWEGMTLLSWFLVVCERREPASRQAGLLYLVMSHLAAGALVLFSALVAPSAGPWNFGAGSHPLVAAASPALLLLLLLVGFGTKAAIVPFHVWLPDAHAAAPSHVSALMSGVLITLGIYGLIRFLPFAGATPAWFACVLILLGAVGICGGVLMALSQRDVKRILAYSTVENAGIMILSLGVALLGSIRNQPLVATLAWAGLFVHLWNHAIMKSLLFYGFGAMAHAMHSRDLEQWGGLFRRWPALSASTSIGGGALCGLPGLVGFTGEWLVLMALFQGVLQLNGPIRILLLVGLLAVVIGSAGAVACFVRLVGIGLLGRPRSVIAGQARALHSSMVLPAVALAAACVATPWAVVPLVRLLLPLIAQVTPVPEPGALLELARPLAGFSIGVACAMALGTAFALLHARRRAARIAPTWGCAHDFAVPRGQYTGNSLTQPITSVLQPVLKTSIELVGPLGRWPTAARWAARTPERALVELYRPAMEHLYAVLARFSAIQHGELTTYLRYVALTLLFLLCLLFLFQSGHP